MEIDQNIINLAKIVETKSKNIAKKEIDGVVDNMDELLNKIVEETEIVL